MVRIKSINFRDTVRDKEGNEFYIINHEFDYPHTTKLTKSQLESTFPNDYKSLYIPSSKDDN